MGTIQHLEAYSLRPTREWISSFLNEELENTEDPVIKFTDNKMKYTAELKVLDSLFINTDETLFLSKRIKNNINEMYSIAIEKVFIPALHKKAENNEMLYYIACKWDATERCFRIIPYNPIKAQYEYYKDNPDKRKLFEDKLEDSYKLFKQAKNKLKKINKSLYIIISLDDT